MYKSAFIFACFLVVVLAEPDSYKPTTYTTSTIANKSDGYWNTGTEVALYLVAIPLLLIPLILIGLKLFERSQGHGGNGYLIDGFGEHSHGHGKSYAPALNFVKEQLLNHLTKRVFDAIKQ